MSISPLSCTMYLSPHLERSSWRHWFESSLLVKILTLVKYQVSTGQKEESIYLRNLSSIGNENTENVPSPVLDILEATFTVSPKTLYRGIVVPTIPAAHGPTNWKFHWRHAKM